MTSSEIEMQNKVVGLKADIFDILRQVEYLNNLRQQKIQELNTLENNLRQVNAAKQVENAEKIEKSEKTENK